MIAAIASDSSEQRSAEPEMLAALALQLGSPLAPKTLKTEEGGQVQVAGFSDEPLVLCETYAHHGSLKAGQKHKIAADALKLVFVEKLLSRPALKIILLADEEAASYLRGRSWLAAALKAMGVEVRVVGIRAELAEAIRAAQARQYR